MSGRPITYNDFGGGISRREGAVNRDRRRAWDILNFQVTPGRKLKRRVPCDLLSGETATENCYLVGGKLTSFMSRLATWTHTVVGLAIDTQILYFDDPPNCLTGVQANYDVIDVVELNAVPIALISHTGTDNIKRLFVHVFDESAADKTVPTYILDGAPPAFWSPALPQHPYGEDTPGVSQEYKPRMTVDGGRCYITLPNGNIAYCAINRPRVWNVRTSSQILQDGRYWYFISTASPAVNTVVVDVAFDSLWGTTDVITPHKHGGFAEVAMEKLNADGTWSALTYAGDAVVSPTAGQYSTQSGNTTTGPNVPVATKVYFHSGGNTGVFRFVARAKPQGIIQSGCQVQGSGTISAGTVLYQGRLLTVPEIPRPLNGGPDVVVSNETYIGFKIGGTLDAPTFTWVWSKNQPKDGTIICALAMDIKPVAGPGTLSGTAGSTTLTCTTNVPPGLVADIYYLVISDGTTSYIRKYKSSPTLVTMTVDQALPASFSGYSWSIHDALDASLISLLGPILAAGPWYTTAGSTTVKFINNLHLPVAEALIGSRLTFTTFASGGMTYAATVINADPLHGTLVMDTPAPATDTGTYVLYTLVYNNAYEIPTPFYLEQEALAVLAAGSGDAGFIGSSQYDPSGAVPVSIYAGQNRLFIQYPYSLQMWGVDSSFNLRYLAKQAIGAGGVPKPQPQMIDDGVLLPTEFGPRIFFPAGNAKDYIEYAPIGDDLHGITLPLFQACAWWQNQSVAVMSSTTAFETELWVYSYNKAANVSGWSRWTIRDTTRFDRIIAAGGTLIILSGVTVYQFNPTATLFKDTADGDGPAYTSRYQGLYTDAGLNAANIKLTRADIAQNGSANHSVLVSVTSPSDEGQRDIVSMGYTYGVSKVPVLAIGPVIAPVVETTDETGYELFSINYDYIALRR